MIRSVPLGELGEIVSGSTPKTSVEAYWNGDIPWVTPADLSDNEGVYFRGRPKRITSEGFRSCSTRMLPSGSILFSSRAPIGHVALTDFPVCTNQGFKSLVPNEKLDPLYAYFALKYLTPLIVARGRGATFAEVNTELMSTVPFPYRSLDKQLQYSSRLQKSDDLVRKYRYSLDKTEALRASMFLRFFDAGARLPSMTVAELAMPKNNAIRTGPFGSQLLHSEFINRGVAVLGIDNAVNNQFVWARRRFISNDKFQTLKRYQVFPGDVLITIMGTCGRCAVVPSGIETAINTKHLCCISLDRARCLPEYLQGAFLYHPTVRRELRVATHGSIMEGLNMEIIKTLRIPLPPIALQERYVTYAKAHARLVGIKVEEVRHATRLFRSLLARTYASMD